MLDEKKTVMLCGGRITATVLTTPVTLNAKFTGEKMLCISFANIKQFPLQCHPFAAHVCNSKQNRNET